MIPRKIPKKSHAAKDDQDHQIDSIDESDVDLSHKKSKRLLVENSVNGKKVSDAVVFGPQFIDLFEQFRQSPHFNGFQLPDKRRHLLALSLDFLIPFARWARQSTEFTDSIYRKLYCHESLRPEVRNGLLMCLVYTFAAQRMTIIANADIFTTLLDKNMGFGIANRYSLRIYNDPFSFMLFLKLSFTGTHEKIYNVLNYTHAN